MEDDDVAERQHGAEVMAAMDNVLLKLQDLSDELSAQGAVAKTDELESSICKAIYDLGNAASPETNKMVSFLPSTARFVETTSGGLREGYHWDGVVVKARDSETGETVALKTLLEFDEEEEEEKAFIPYHVLREACFMAACRGHPSLVGLSGIARHPHTGDYSLVMENVGPRLHDVLHTRRRGGKPFPEHRVRRVMRQVLSGAKAMHDRGVVHHSIHSMNIFVTDGGGKGAVKIGDFSDAMSISETTVGFAARLSHVAPECFLDPQGRDNDGDMDSWSMGCLMLELVTGVDHFGAGIDDDENDAQARLQRIDDVLGLSDERIMEASMKLVVDVELSPEVQRYRLQWRGGDRLRELVPREVLSDRGLAVLQGLLMYSPKGRLTASSALQHPWFTDTFNRPKPRPFTWVLVGVVALFSLMVFVCHRRWC